MPEQEIVSHFDFYMLTNGLRSAANVGAAAYNLISGSTRNETSNENSGLLEQDKRNIFASWMTVEFAFGVLVIAGLLTRYCRLNGCCKLLKNTRLEGSARYVLLIRFSMAIFSLIAGGLLASDLSGETERTTVAAVLIVLSTFLSSSLMDLFKKVDEKKEQRLQSSVFARNIGLREGEQVADDHVYTLEDMRLALKATILNYSTFKNNNICNILPFRLTRNVRDNEIVLITPPVVIRNDQGNIINGQSVRFSDGIGYGIEAFFNHANTHGLTKDIFTDIRRELTAPKNMTYRILFISRNLFADDENKNNWSSVEVKINQNHNAAAAHNTYDITIIAHSPRGGAHTMPVALYASIATQIRNRLTAQPLQINQQNIHFIDRAGANVDNIAAINAENMPQSNNNAGVLSPARMLMGNEVTSSLIVLNDISRLMQGKDLSPNVFTSQQIEHIRMETLVNVMRRLLPNEVREFRGRAIVPEKTDTTAAPRMD